MTFSTTRFKTALSFIKENPRYNRNGYVNMKNGKPATRKVHSYAAVSGNRVLIAVSYAIDGKLEKDIVLVTCKKFSGRTEWGVVGETSLRKGFNNWGMVLPKDLALWYLQGKELSDLGSVTRPIIEKALNRRQRTPKHQNSLSVLSKVVDLITTPKPAYTSTGGQQLALFS